MGLEQLIETQIRDAMAAGAFSNLPGAGKPLPPTDVDRLAGDNWLGYKVLQNGGLLPEWLNLAREVERDEEALSRLDREHEQLVATASETGEWERFDAGIAYAERRYEELARQLRRKQDRFNVNAPGPNSQRPGIWVEFHLERLRRRAQDARGE